MTTKKKKQKENVVCPFCGSEKIVTVRGELEKQSRFQECQCTICTNDFFVSY